MENEKLLQKAHRKVAKIIHELDREGADFPLHFGFQKNKSSPHFEMVVNKTESDSFVDENGQKWVKA